MARFRSILLVLLGLALATAAILAAVRAPQLLFRALAPYQGSVHHRDVFRVWIPDGWTELEGEERTAFQVNYEKQAAAWHLEYYGIPMPADMIGLHYLAVLTSPDRESILSMARVRIPPQEENYLDRRLEESHAAFKHAKQKGMVRDVGQVAIREVNGNRCLYGEGRVKESRIRTYGFFSQNHPYQFMSVSLLSPGTPDRRFQTMLEQSMDIEIGRHLTLGGEQLYLSEEAQESLIVAEQSRYVSEGHVLIVQEPHYNSDGQQHLFKGLLALARDNPWWPPRVVFLAEAVSAQDRVDVEALVETLPNPSTEIVDAVLGSFLIPGYVAYAWSEPGPDVLGTEDAHLYDTSAQLWTNEDYVGWSATVSARNARMAQVTMEQLKNGVLPVLFVGGMHLHALTSDDFAESLRGLRERSDIGAFSRFGDVRNKGIVDYFRDARVGYTYLEPVSRGENRVQDEALYRELFRVQQGGSYDRYVADYVQIDSGKFLLAALERESEGVKSAGVTVRPAPKAAAKVAASVATALERIRDFLGDGFRRIANAAGDKVFLSKDGNRRVRFDINRTNPHKNLHGHAEEKVDGQWRGRRAYPRDVEAR